MALSSSFSLLVLLLLTANAGLLGGCLECEIALEPGATECPGCEIGRYGATPNCNDCLAGQYAGGGDKSECTVCPIGWHGRDTKPYQECTACPAGQFAVAAPSGGARSDEATSCEVSSTSFYVITGLLLCYFVTSK